MKHITITAGPISLPAQLNDSPTAQKIWDALHIEGRANTWGDEIHFDIPVIATQEPGARAEVEVGELGYWPAGHAFCIFFGPTPASRTTNPAPPAPSIFWAGLRVMLPAFGRWRMGQGCGWSKKHKL